MFMYLYSGPERLENLNLLRSLCMLAVYTCMLMLKLHVLS